MRASALAVDPITTAASSSLCRGGEVRDVRSCEDDAVIRITTRRSKCVVDAVKRGVATGSHIPLRICKLLLTRNDDRRLVRAMGVRKTTALSGGRSGLHGERRRLDFLSYAHDDDLTTSASEDEAGFVTFLYRMLDVKLRDLGATRAKIWLDRRRVADGDQFDDVIDEGLKKRNYCSSSCRTIGCSVPIA